MALPLSLHTWSGAWSLPSIEPDSIAVITYLQIAFPGRWMLVESNDPDASPNGQLPFLEHGPHTISSLSGILAYLSKLSFDDVSSQPTATVTSPTGLRPKSTDLDEGLSEGRRAESVAWKAIVESELADLTNYVLWCPMANYEVLHEHIASSLPFPQSHYLPGRLRALHQERLAHVGLWALAPKDASARSRNRLNESLGMGVEKLQTPVVAASEAQTHKFADDQLIARADPTLSVLAGLLARSSTSFFFDSPEPTTLDLHLFAHLSLILLPPFPSSTLPSHIRSTYPSLQQHTFRILSLTFPPDSPDAWPRQAALAEGRGAGFTRLWQALGSSVDVAKALVGVRPKETGSKRSKKEITKEEKDFAKKRIWWLAGVGISTVVYLFASGLIQVNFGGEDEEDEYGEEELVEEEALNP